MVKNLNERYPKPSWLKLSEDELKVIIKKLAEKNPPAQIGLILRDQYGVPTTRVYGKKLAKYLEEIGIENNSDLKNVEVKLEKIREHLKKHITDKRTKHKLQVSQSKLNAMKKYATRKNTK